MGNLVFQATLGGQVNLVGPNTASTFNLNVPATSSTIATLTGTETFTNKTLTSPTLTAPVLGTPSSGTLTNCTGLPNAGLVNSSVTVGSTAIALGATATTVAGLTSLATNTLTSAASTALTLQSAGTTAITVDTSQNVGIGTTSPVASTKLTINGSNDQIYLRTADTNAVVMSIGNAAGNSVYFQSKATGTGTALPFAWYMGGTQSMTLDTSGRLIIGNTAAQSTGAAYPIQVKAVGGGAGGYGILNSSNVISGGISLGSSADNSLVITADPDNLAASSYIGMNVDGTERMRITSAGSLLVGTTSISFGEKLSIKSDSSGSGSDGIYIANSSGTTLFRVRSDGAFQTGGASLSPYNNTAAVSANCYINTDGTLLRATSSLKYKRDVQDAPFGLAEVLRLRAVTYKGKNEVDGEKVYGGLIAEQVDEIGLTQFVQYAEDGTPDALHYGNMVSLCVKAIQELKAINDSLTARIVALESK